jgi:hypothetical protein
MGPDWRWPRCREDSQGAILGPLALRARGHAASGRPGKEITTRIRRPLELAILVAATVAILVAVVTAGRAGHPPAVPAALPGTQTGPAPWGANTADLAARLRAIGLPPLNPIEGTAVHIHQHLDIYVDGRKVPVPALIGIDPAVGFAPLHVHDTSGVIHVESPTVRSYTLGQFFGVWGVRLTPSCLGGYCTGGGRRLRVYVNGTLDQADPTTLVLEPHQEILIAYGTPAQVPSPIPASYRFPPGE